MEEFIQSVMFCYITFFVTMDPVGLMPLFLTLTEGRDAPEKRKVIITACLTALIVTVGFMCLGRTVFSILGITLNDFLISGGIILFCFAITDLITTGRRKAVDQNGSVGPVPLGTPMMAGPGVLAASLLLLAKHDTTAVLTALVACVLTAAVSFAISTKAVKILRESGVRAISRVAALFLSAFAVMMIRRGIMAIVAGIDG